MTISIDSPLTPGGFGRQHIPQGDHVSAQADGAPLRAHRDSSHPSAAPFTARGGDTPRMEPLTAAALASRLGVSERRARAAIEQARVTGAHPVTRGASTARGGRPPWVIWWPVATEQAA